jgi:hypothetical protein
MPLISKQVARSKRLARPKHGARPTARTPLDVPDPLGFGARLAELVAEMQDAYQAPLRAPLHELLLVSFSPTSLRRMLDAHAARDRPAVFRDHPVGFLAKIMMYPGDANGFCRAVGTLLRITGTSPIAESDEQPDDDPEDPPLTTDTCRNPISKSDYEEGLRKSRGRR